MGVVTNQTRWVGVLPAASERLSTATQTQVSVGVASTTILAANSARVSFLVRNISSVDVYVYLGAIATLLNGVLLEKGDSIFGDCYTGIITGIVAAGTATVSVIEV